VISRQDTGAQNELQLDPTFYAERRRIPEELGASSRFQEEPLREGSGGPSWRDPVRGIA